MWSVLVQSKSALIEVMAWYLTRQIEVNNHDENKLVLCEDSYTAHYKNNALYPSGLLHWHWAIMWLPQCQWSNPWRIWVDISYKAMNNWWYNQNKTRHNPAMCILHGIYCILHGIYCIMEYLTWWWHWTVTAVSGGMDGFLRGTVVDKTGVIVISDGFLRGNMLDKSLIATETLMASYEGICNISKHEIKHFCRWQAFYGGNM